MTGADPEGAEERATGPELTAWPGRDPFAGHLAFVDRFWPNPPRTASMRPGFDPVDPIDTRADKLVDFDALEALAQWSGNLLEPREMRADEYPMEVEEAMAEREPQFHLRNLSRVERVADPDHLEEMGRYRVERGLEVEGAGFAGGPTYEAPKLIEPMLLDTVAWRKQTTRELLDDNPWERHFGREIKENWGRPMWKYDPDAEDPDAVAEGPEPASE